MVKPFSEALAGMEKGTYTKEPVQTQFGWHVIILDDSRDSTVPSFEQVKPQLKMMAQNQRVQDYVASLRSDATIDIKQTAAPAGAETAQPATAPETPAAPGGSDTAGETGAAE
jgi:peptidyl-prolyl cis-trans isomerase C